MEGKPVQFNIRTPSGGYYTTSEHRLIAERVLGRELPPGVEIHHVNKIRDDNKNSNLVICQDNAYHSLLHKRMRAKEATGNPNSPHCDFCRQYGHSYDRACRTKDL